MELGTGVAKEGGASGRDVGSGVGSGVGAEVALAVGSGAGPAVGSALGCEVGSGAGSTRGWVVTPATTTSAALGTDAGAALETLEVQALGRVRAQRSHLPSFRE